MASFDFVYRYRSILIIYTRVFNLILFLLLSLDAFVSLSLLVCYLQEISFRFHRIEQTLYQETLFTAACK